MSKFNFMEKLLDGIDIKWTPLKEITEILNGFAFKSAKYSDVGIRIIRISDVQKGRISDNSLKFYPIATIDDISKYLLKENDLVMSLTGNVGRVAMLSKANLPAALNQRVACIRTKDKGVLIRYLFHFFGWFSFENEAMINATGGGQKNMGTKWLSSYPIPIPCPENPKKSLEIQAEIVCILDAFTAVTSKLASERTAREKQYKYYRNQLLSFEKEDVEWKTLGEICGIIKTGKLNANAKSDDGIYPFFTCHKKAYKINTYAFNMEAILISGNGSQVGHLNYYKGKFNAYQRTYVIGDFQNMVKTFYLYHYLKHALKSYISTRSKKGSVPYITMSMLTKFAVPIPSLAKQTRIIDILNKFDALTNSITEGLPREIELRQKQYEYYRDLLFSFPKPTVVA